MADVVGDIMFPNGKYISGSEEKTRWLKCGVLLQTDKGYRIKLECLPINMGEGWFNVFEPKNEGGGHQASQPPGNKKPPKDPEIPF